MTEGAASPAEDLLLRVVEERFAGLPCERCGALDEMTLALQAQALGQAVIEATCQSCGWKALIKVQPDDVAGSVQVGSRRNA